MTINPNTRIDSYDIDSRGLEEIDSASDPDRLQKMGHKIVDVAGDLIRTPPRIALNLAGTVAQKIEDLKS